MRLNIGENDEYRSGVSILFSSPLPRIRVMGAGCRGGPKRNQQRRSAGETACQGRGAQEWNEPQLRHEHADDDQRL